jgi:hypothetical protein
MPELFPLFLMGIVLFLVISIIKNMSNYEMSMH